MRFRMEIELREDEGRLGPGRLVGTVIKYGERAKDRAEVFEVGSLTWPSSGIVLNRQHSRKSPIMRVTPTVEGNEVRIDAPLPDSTAGRDAAVEVRSGLMTGLSIEFRATAETFVSGVRRITAAILGGVGLVDSPAYGTSVEVRAKGGGNRPN